ncbi:MAG: tetratricopeptide repeat protein [Bacteroidales bacterium]|nr:tetratricopeptide repeat protein [Bacteroidales bacterium]MCF8403746.1 tetratricopeptide repeat protein [Bacteroidales bacterium]
MAFFCIRHIYFILVCPLIIFGQNYPSEIDSLESIPKSKLTTLQNAEILNKLAYLYRVQNPEKAIEYAQQALNIAEQNNLATENQKALSHIGLGYKYLGDYDNAIVYQKLALEHAVELKNKNLIAVEYNRLGILFKRLGLYTNALDYYEQALAIYIESEKTKGIADLYNNIGNIYRKRGDMDVALDYYFKTLKMIQVQDDQESYAYILNNIGNLYSDMEIFDLALEYHKKSLDVKKEMENYYGIATSLQNISDVYLNLKEPEIALKYIDECFDLAKLYGYNDILIELNTSYGLAYLILGQFNKAHDFFNISIEKQAELGDIPGLIKAYIGVSKIFIQQGLYKEAEEHLLKSLILAEKENFLHDIAEINLQLSIVSEKTEQFSKSLLYFKKYSSIRDSIFNTDIGNKISEIKIKQKSEEFEAEKTILEEKNKFQQLSIRRKNQFIYAMISLTFLVLILVILIFLEYKNKHKVNKNLKIINQKLFDKNSFLQVLMDTIPNPMYYTDNKGNYIDCNSAFRSLHGLRENEIVGKSVFDIFSKEIAEKIHNDDAELFRNQGMQQKELTFTSKNGESKDVIYYKNTFNNSRGKVAGIVGLLLDISERKKAEEKIKKSEQELRKANATKDKFFSIIAHDLKNPFGAILGFANILNTEFEFLPDEEKISIISNLSMASENTYKLLQNLLEWSRTQTGQLEINPEVFDLNIVTNENISVLNTLGHSKKITIDSNIKSDTLVKADKNMINTVFRNLLSNAIKFTEPGGKVEVLGHTSNGSITIKFIDNGIGIERKNMNKLFSIDQQFRRKGTANEMGSGLGLILCKEFIEKNKGSIKVESEPGKGSTFSVQLPAA